MAVSPLNAISLCSGIGGIDLGLRAACPRVRAVCYVEREAFPASVLAARMEEGRMDPAPIWSDLTTFDGRPWRGGVDLIHGGVPCQPWSASGKRTRTKDHRWIWSDVCRIIRECEPRRAVFVENVPGLVKGGIQHILWDLAQEGFDAEWGVYRALDVGAPHRRARLFILAYRPDEFDGLLRATFEGTREGHEPRELPARVANGGDDGRGLGGQAHHHDGGDELGHHADGRHEDLPGGDPSQPGPGFPPAPCEEGAWERFFDAGGPFPAIRRGADGIPNRVERLRALGNAVVPKVIAFAWRDLLRQAQDSRRSETCTSSS